MIIIYNYPPKGRWIVVDIYRDAKRRGIYPPLFTDPEGDSCWTADLISSKLWSSQLWTQLKQLRIEAWKKSGLQRGRKSAVQHMKYFIYHFTSILQGFIRTHKWPAPNVSGFIAQLVRASHRYHEVTGSNPVEVLTFSGFYTQFLKLRSQLRWS